MANLNGRPYSEIDVARALAAFSGQTISVQTARTVKKTGEDGRERQVFVTEDKPLAAEHVLSAKQWNDGKVTVTTIDGRRHEAKGKLPAPKDADKDAGKGADKGAAK